MMNTSDVSENRMYQSFFHLSSHRGRGDPAQKSMAGFLLRGSGMVRVTRRSHDCDQRLPWELLSQSETSPDIDEQSKLNKIEGLRDPVS